MEPPSFLIGDTVHIDSYGEIVGTGVVTAEEIWTEPDNSIAWDGLGKRPADKRFPSLVTRPPRFLIRMLSFSDIPGSDTEYRAAWRQKCLASSCNFPYVSDRDLLLVSRPQVRALTDNGCLGSVIGIDPVTGASCVSESEAGARLQIAEIKASRSILQVAP
jgi:hypothetical protein